MRKITLSALMLFVAHGVIAEEQPAPDVSFSMLKSSTPATMQECLRALEDGKIIPHGGPKDGRGTLIIIYAREFFLFDFLSTAPISQCTKLLPSQEN